MTRRIAHKLETQWRSQDVLQSEDENATFEEFLLSKQLLSGLRKSGFVRPSPIQLRAIPLGLCGFDMVVQAKSGTGKTCVFSVLTLQAVNVSNNAVQVLILAPTREIAVQSCDTVCCLGCDMPELKAYAFIGGVPIKEDLQKLARCHVAVGTLGRLLQLIQQGQLSLERVRLLVLDEADQLLGEGFQEDLRKLWASLPERRQVVAASATYPPEVARILEEELLRKPMLVRLGVDAPALLGVSQWYCVAEGTNEAAWFSRKLHTLDKLLRRMPFSQCLVFLNSQARAQSLEERLRHAGHRAQLLSGAQAQSERIKALVCLKAYRCRILVSTDLAARGIDAERVNLVIHFDVAYDLETHLHRSGRAGRYGTAGQAVTLVTGLEELERLRTLCAPLNLDIRPLPGSPSCESGSNTVQLNGDVSSVVTEQGINEAVVQKPSSDVAPFQGNSYSEAGCFTPPSLQNISKVTCAQLVQMPKNTSESSSTNSPEEICVKERLLSVSAVSQPLAESGSVRRDIQAMQLLMSTVKSTPGSYSKEVHPKVVQSLLGTSKLTPTKDTSGAKNIVLQPVMEPSLKLREILMAQKVPPRVQPLLQWPPDPSLGKELAARIQEEKEAFSKAYGVVFEPGGTLKIAIAQRVSEQNCACPSTGGAIRSHDEGKTEDSKAVVHLDAAADGSCVKEKQEPSDISPEVVDIQKVVSSHEKSESEARHILHSDKAVYVKTNEGQQELSVQASVSKDTSRELGDTATRDSVFPKPPTSCSGHRECKPKERCGAAQVRETTGSLKNSPDKSGTAAEAPETESHVVHNSEHKHSSLDATARIKGRMLQSGPQSRSLGISRELKKTLVGGVIEREWHCCPSRTKTAKGCQFWQRQKRWRELAPSPWTIRKQYTHSRTDIIDAPSWHKPDILVASDEASRSCRERLQFKRQSSSCRNKLMP
ncbi:hypothetical protein MTO96_021778 [Rhipicephalus appendiculatus]